MHQQLGARHQSKPMNQRSFINARCIIIIINMYLLIMSTNTCVRVGESDTRIHVTVSEVEIWRVGATMHVSMHSL